MEKTWGLLNEDKTEIIKTFVNGGNKMMRLGKYQASQFPPQFLRKHGWIPYIVPTVSAYQKLGNIVISAFNYTHEVVLDRTVEEINANKALQLKRENIVDRLLTNAANKRTFNQQAAIVDALETIDDLKRHMKRQDRIILALLKDRAFSEETEV